MSTGTSRTIEGAENGDLYKEDDGLMNDGKVLLHSINTILPLVVDTPSLRHACCGCLYLLLEYALDPKTASRGFG